ncbi:MAG: TIM barrel protein, partial [Anaerolineae bacterium]|nr:TIM barrel protein [Anaerolineae bacterium]
MKLSLAIQTPEVPVPVPVALLTGSFPDKLAKARRLGADGVELLTVDPKALDLPSIRAALEESGLEVAAVGSGAVAFAAGLTLLHADPAVATQARQRLRDLVDLAAQVQAPLVTIGSFRGRVTA